FGAHLLYVADSDAPPGQFAADCVEVLDYELDAFDRAGFSQRQACADYHRACRAGRGHLHNSHGPAWCDVVVEMEADLLGVEVLRSVDIADREWNDLELHVHEASR